MFKIPENRNDIASRTPRRLDTLAADAWCHHALGCGISEDFRFNLRIPGYVCFYFINYFSFLKLLYIYIVRSTCGCMFVHL